MNEKLKILFITTSFPRYKDDPLAAGTFILELAKNINNLGHHVTVLAPGVTGIPNRYEIDGVNIVRIKYAPEKYQKLTNNPGGIPVLIKNKSPVLAFFPSLFFNFFRVTGKTAKDYDIIHAHWLFNAFSPVLSKPLHRKKVVVSIRGSDIINKKIVLLYSKFLKFTDGIISVNEEGLKNFDNLNIAKAHIPNGVYINKIKISDKPIVIATSGYFIKRKNLKILAEALKIVNDKGFDFKAFFIGDGEEKNEIKEIVKDFKNKIVFTGFVPQKDVIGFLDKSHIFVLPSLFEGRSNSLLEAMANGKAVIVSDIPQNREIVIDNENGLIFATTSAIDLAEKLILLIQKRELVTNFGENAQKTIIKMGLTWENSAKKHVEFYKQIINSK